MRVDDLKNMIDHINNFQNTNDTTILDHVVIHSNVEYIKLLISHGVDVGARNKDGDNLLMVAAQLGQVKAVEMFINCGLFNINEKNKDGKTPLDMAEEAGNTEVVKILKEKITQDKNENYWVNKVSPSSKLHNLGFTFEK